MMTIEDLVEELEQETDATRRTLARVPNDKLRSVLFNHWYHHRGQLTVYLRQVGASVPAIYGASADETPLSR